MNLYPILFKTEVFSTELICFQLQHQLTFVQFPVLSFHFHFCIFQERV